MSNSIFKAVGVVAAVVAVLFVDCTDNGTNPAPAASYILNIEINPVGGGAVSRNPDKTVYGAEETVSVTATAKTGYDFVNWSGAVNSTSRTVTVTMSRDMTITANFRQATVTPPSGNTFTDSRDGKTYKKVTIGNQTWMAENLNYNASGSKCYNNNNTNCDRYGRLYDWPTAMNGSSSSSRNPSGVRGICPSGWHLPSDAEWILLTDYVGLYPGEKLKATSGWANNDNGTDEYGFSALPGGLVNSVGDFGSAGDAGNWWCATEMDDDWSARTRMILISVGFININYYKTGLLSVRCIRD